MTVTDRAALAQKLNIAANHITRIREKLGHSTPSNSEIPKTEAAEVELVQGAIVQGKSFEDAIASVIETRDTDVPKRTKTTKAGSLDKRQSNQSTSQQKVVESSKKAATGLVKGSQRLGKNAGKQATMAFANEAFKELGDGMEAVSAGIDFAFDQLAGQQEEAFAEIEAETVESMDFLPQSQGADATSKGLLLLGWQA